MHRFAYDFTFSGARGAAAERDSRPALPNTPVIAAAGYLGMTVSEYACRQAEIEQQGAERRAAERAAAAQGEAAERAAEERAAERARLQMTERLGEEALRIVTV